MEVPVEGLTTMLVIGLLSDVVKGGSASYIFCVGQIVMCYRLLLYIPKGVLKEEWWQAMDALRAGQLAITRIKISYFWISSIPAHTFQHLANQDLREQLRIRIYR